MENGPTNMYQTLATPDTTWVAGLAHTRLNMEILRTINNVWERVLWNRRNQTQQLSMFLQAISNTNHEHNLVKFKYALIGSFMRTAISTVETPCIK